MCKFARGCRGMRNRIERHIAALQRMGYEVGASSYGDDYGLEMDGYTIFCPNGNIAIDNPYALEELASDAWFSFLEQIGRNNTERP